jgi:hypothetical protein
MAAVEHAARSGIEDLEGADHRAGGKRLDLEPAARHLIDALGEHLEVVEEHARYRDRALDP